MSVALLREVYKLKMLTEQMAMVLSLTMTHLENWHLIFVITKICFQLTSTMKMELGKVIPLLLVEMEMHQYQEI